MLLLRRQSGCDFILRTNGSIPYSRRRIVHILLTQLFLHPSQKESAQYPLHKYLIVPLVPSNQPSPRGIKKSISGHSFHV